MIQQIDICKRNKQKLIISYLPVYTVKISGQTFGLVTSFPKKLDRIDLILPSP